MIIAITQSFVQMVLAIAVLIEGGASQNNRPRRANYFLQSKGGSQTHPAPLRVSLISPYFYLIFAFALGRSGGAERGFAKL